MVEIQEHLSTKTTLSMQYTLPADLTQNAPMDKIGPCGIQTFPQGLTGYMKPSTLTRDFHRKKKLKQKTALSMLPLQLPRLLPPTSDRDKAPHDT